MYKERIMDNLLTFEQYKNYLKDRVESIPYEIKECEDRIKELNEELVIINSTICFVYEIEKKYYYEERGKD